MFAAARERLSSQVASARPEVAYGLLETCTGSGAHGRSPASVGGGMVLESHGVRKRGGEGTTMAL